MQQSNDNWRPDPDGWRKRYNETGYLVVENAVDPDTLGKLRDGLEKIEAGVKNNTLPENLRKWISLDKDRTLGSLQGLVRSDTISNIMELPRFDRLFADFILYPRVLDILEALFGSSEFSFHNYKCICKMPGSKAPFQWHRDLPYLQHTTPNLITCMVCLDAMTEENGATIVCPGTHKIAHEDVKQSDTDMPESEVPANRVTVECPAGSAVLFHASIIHGGPANRSDTKRRNAISIWAGPNVYPANPNRYIYQFIMPRSKDPERQRQIAMTFGTK